MHPLNCINCNKVFYVKEYRLKTAKWCSMTCRKLNFKCLLCGNDIIDSPSRKRKFCSKPCANKARNQHKISPNKSNNFRRFWFRRGIIKKCEKCGYDEVKEILGIHHIDGNRENNIRENLMVVCPNCHSLIHRMHIPHGALRK
jgi:5-methylcytosine-specific restriction endonuclease McrA